MKHIVLTLCLFGLLMSSNVQAGQEANLKGFTKVCVKVFVDRGAESLGVSSAAVVRDVETQLRKGGVKIGIDDENLPQLIVKVEVIEHDILSARVRTMVELKDIVTIERTKQRTWASIWALWNFGNSAQVNAARDAMRSITTLTDSFLNDLNKAN